MRAQGEDAHGRGFPPEFWSELAMSLVDKRSLPDRRTAGMDANEYHGQRERMLDRRTDTLALLHVGWMA